VILRSLTIENFRQFYGTQRLDFASAEDKNVSVIYGANGAGKTALLNAFTWGLYKATSPAFDKPDDVVNHRAWGEAAPGDEVTARVIVVFEHENNTFTLERATTDRKREGDERVRVRDGVVTLTVVDEGGRSEERSNPDGSINAILPDRLHRFFFFDGERIENLVKPAAYAEIEDAIKTVLGLEVIERAVRHLGEARKALDKRVSEVGSDEDKRLQAEKEDLEAVRERKREERKTTEANKTAREAELSNVNDQLEGLEEAHELQQRREELEQAVADAQRRMADSRQALATKVNGHGYLAFVNQLAADTIERFEERRDRGEIPADIKLQFVQDRLELGECICGTKLVDGEEPYARVADWMTRAVRSDVEAAWNRLPAQAKALYQSRDDFYDYLHETSRELADHREQRRRYDEKLSEIKEQVEEIDSAQVQQLEARRDELKQGIDTDNQTIGAISRDLQNLEARIDGLEKELESVREENQRSELAKRRARVAREAREVFEGILQLRTGSVRRQLDQRIKALYARISFKPYTPTLNDSFHLELTKSIGDGDASVARSTGENQILSLAFVGAVAEHARDRFREAKGNGGGDGTLSFQGGIYPVVMDSPFGSLDENYQRQIARAIPELAPQVIVLVSKSQGLSVVQDELLPRVGREAVIEYHTPKKDADSEEIELRVGRRPYIEKTDGPFEWAVVTTV
jgi:DNA sulfur modification protein DndD